MKRCITKFQSRIFGRFIQTFIMFKIPNAWRGLLEQELFKNLKETSRKPTSQSHLISRFFTLATVYLEIRHSKLRLLNLAQNCKSLAFLGGKQTNTTKKPHHHKHQTALLHLFFLLLPRQLFSLPTCPPAPAIASSLAPATASFQPCYRCSCLLYSSFFNLITISDFPFPNVFLEPFKEGNMHSTIGESNSCFNWSWVNTHQQN